MAKRRRKSANFHCLSVCFFYLFSLRNIEADLKKGSLTENEFLKKKLSLVQKSFTSDQKSQYDELETDLKEGDITEVINKHLN